MWPLLVLAQCMGALLVLVQCMGVSHDTAKEARQERVAHSAGTCGYTAHNHTSARKLLLATEKKCQKVSRPILYMPHVAIPATNDTITGINYVEVRPSLRATADIARN